MDPLSHVMTGWLLSRPLEEKRDRLIVTALTLSADLDGLTLIRSKELYWKWHHVCGHNAFAALLATAAAACLAKDRGKAALLAAAGFHLHLLMDLVGSGEDWGIAYGWPLFEHVFRSRPPLLWEHNAWQNVVIAAFLMFVVLRLGWRHGRTVLELVSEKADRSVVRTLRARFGQP